jgi:hypothetical protein
MNGTAIVERSAELSPCGLYRYRLGRRWDDTPTLAWVMLNPSTADAESDDPTIRRCMGFARSWGYGGIEVLNLSPLRSTDPTALLTTHVPFEVQDYNRELISQAAGGAIVAWGSHPVARKATWARRMLWGSHCLGVTKDGEPRHPLYVRADAERMTWPT